MSFNVKKTVLQFQSMIGNLVETMDNDYGGPAKKGSGKRTKRTEDVDKFSALEIVSKSKNNAHVNITVGDEYSVEIEIDDDLQEIIDVDNKRGKLVIRSTEKYESARGLRITVITKSLDKISTEGSVLTFIDKLDSNAFKARTAGFSKLQINGKIAAGIIETNGTGGDTDLSKLSAQRIDLTINGAGQANLNVSEKLRVIINGSGSVKYTGNPKTVNKIINGAGFVTPEN